VFSELRLISEDGRVLDLLAPIAQPSLVSHKSNVRIYIVPIGGVQGLGLDELPEFLPFASRHIRSIIDPIPLEPKARNTARAQLIFEELIELMHARYPQLAKDKSAFLIGVTDEDMYIQSVNWNFAYTAYDPPKRAGGSLQRPLQYLIRSRAMRSCFERAPQDGEPNHGLCGVRPAAQQMTHRA